MTLVTIFDPWIVQVLPHIAWTSRVFCDAAVRHSLGCHCVSLVFQHYRKRAYDINRLVQQDLDSTRKYCKNSDNLIQYCLVCKIYEISSKLDPLTFYEVAPPPKKNWSVLVFYSTRAVTV